jgi:flagellar M-ring protein FliF
MDRTSLTSMTADAGPTAANISIAGLTLLRSLGPGRIIALGMVAIALLAFFAFIVARAVERPYTLLFGGLASADAREIVMRLESLGIPFRLTPTGDAILVPASEALTLRMTLAQEGLPTGGTVGNELFDEISGLTTTDFLADVNLRRAVEGELARSIASLRPVRQARVHVVWPKRDLFRREGDKASASVVLSLAGPETLDRRQIAGIRHLVAGAIPGLSPEQVSIVDERGNLLARPDEPGGRGGSMDDLEEHRAAFEQRVRAKVRDLLERSVGPGRVDVEVSADFDFDQVEITVERFDPESQVARSTQTVEEDAQRSDIEAADAVGVSGNLPVEAANAAAAPGKSDERTRRSEETTNFEISRTVTNQRRRAPLLRRLSIAVQVDAVNRSAPGEPPMLEPRSDAELAQLEALVRSAAGVDDERGDVVSVVSRELVATPVAAEEAPSLLGAGQQSLWRAAELATLAGLGLAMIFLVVRPALRRLLPAEASPRGTPAAADAGRGTAPTGDIEGAAAPNAPLGPPGAALEGMAGPEPTTQLHQVQGAVRSSLIEEIGQLVESQPDDAVRVVRGWLHGT